MIVVSDTSAISALLRIGHLHLLKSLYQDVIIPPAVERELSELKNWGYDLGEVFSQDWISVREVKRGDYFQKLQSELDEGEAEAIALAKEIDADLLLIDEMKGRKIAAHEGLKIVGVLGVLLEAKLLNFVDEVKPLLGSLVEKANFRISEKLRQKVLALAGEKN